MLLLIFTSLPLSIPIPLLPSFLLQPCLFLCSCRQPRGTGLFPTPTNLQKLLEMVSTALQSGQQLVILPAISAIRHLLQYVTQDIDFSVTHTKKLSTPSMISSLWVNGSVCTKELILYVISKSIYFIGIVPCNSLVSILFLIKEIFLVKHRNP